MADNYVSMISINLQYSGTEQQSTATEVYIRQSDESRQQGRLTSVETPKRRFHGRLSSPPPNDVSRRATCAVARARCLACVLRLRSRCFRSAMSSVGVTGRILVSVVVVVVFVSISPATSQRGAYHATEKQAPVERVLS